jgi:hypothetical protein
MEAHGYPPAMTDTVLGHRAAPEQLVDLARYPVGDLASATGRTAIAAAQQSLARSGAAELEGFVTPEGVEVLVDDAERLEAQAHHSGGWGTAYLELPDPDVPAGHPRRWLGPYGVGAVAYDLFPPDSPLRRLYEWDPLKDLVEAVLQRGTLHRYADAFGALNLAAMGAGDELQWHFDQTDFVVSLAIRPAAEGGDFEVAPRIRNPDDERFGDVASVLAGDRSGVVCLPMRPGTLLVFEGRHSLHRVSPISGPTSRLVALLAYDTAPGTVGSELLHENRYGRTTPRVTAPS